jgi:hypothetical protein
VAARADTGEIALGRSVYGEAIDWRRIEIRRRRWWPLQRRDLVMAPMGHIHIHPAADFWSEDFFGSGFPCKACSSTSCATYGNGSRAHFPAAAAASVLPL